MGRRHFSNIRPDTVFTKWCINRLVADLVSTSPHDEEAESHYADAEDLAKQLIRDLDLEVAVPSRYRDLLAFCAKFLILAHTRDFRAPGGKFEAATVVKVLRRDMCWFELPEHWLFLPDDEQWAREYEEHCRCEFEQPGWRPQVY